MMQPYQQSSQGSSEKSPSSHSKQLLHHVLKNVLRITTDERVSFSKWMEYNHYHNIHELCEELPFGLKDLYDCSDYIVNGQHCVLKLSTMHKIKLFISWMLTRMKGNTFKLSSQFFLSLKYQDFNKFRQENMFRMTKVPTTQTPSTTKPFLSHISRSKTKLASLPHYIDLFGESVCESAEENPLHLDELKSSLFNLLQILLNFQNPPRLLFPIKPGKDFV